MQNVTIIEDRKVQTRYENFLDTRVRIEITDDPDDTRRFRAVLEAADPPVPTLTVGDEIGFGRTAARARRRAVDRIANRRRGPIRSSYTVHGVTFVVTRNEDPAVSISKMFTATVTEVSAESPVRPMVAVGMELAALREAANAADRATYLLSQWAESARLDGLQRQLEGGALVGVPSDPPSWDDDALCRQIDPDMFFPDAESNAGQQNAAISICGRCSAQVECLARAIDNDERYGVWGGTSEFGRRSLRQAGVTGDLVRERGMKVLDLIREYRENGTKAADL